MPTLVPPPSILRSPETHWFMLTEQNILKQRYKFILNLDTNPLLFDVKAMTLEYPKKTCLQFYSCPNLKHEIYTFFITRILNYFRISIKIGNGIYSNSLKTMDFFFRFSFFFKFIRFTVSLKIINFIFYKRCEIYFLLAIFSMVMPHSAHEACRMIKVFMN